MQACIRSWVTSAQWYVCRGGGQLALASKGVGTTGVVAGSVCGSSLELQSVAQRPCSMRVQARRHGDQR